MDHPLRVVQDNGAVSFATMADVLLLPLIKERGGLKLTVLGWLLHSMDLNMCPNKSIFDLIRGCLNHWVYQGHGVVGDGLFLHETPELVEGALRDFVAQNEHRLLLDISLEQRDAIRGAPDTVQFVCNLLNYPSINIANLLFLILVLAMYLAYN